MVKGGNHIAALLGARVTERAMDAIAVRADPGGGPPPHRHGFGEWFYVLEGSLQVTSVVDGEVVPFCTAGTRSGYRPTCGTGPSIYRTGRSASSS